jgi:hypothetical protein
MGATMLNFNTFLKGFHLFKENFEFSSSELYTESVYNALKNKLTDKRYLDTCTAILEGTSKQDWNEAYGFKGRPAIADWLDVFIPKPVEKKRYNLCEKTGAKSYEIYFDYPDDYLAELNQNKQGKLEAGDSLNKNNRLPQLEAIKTNLIKKL